MIFRCDVLIPKLHADFFCLHVALSFKLIWFQTGRLKQCTTVRLLLLNITVKYIAVFV